jgi:hypothetical protein
MLNINEAIDVVKKTLPNSKIISFIEHKDLFIFNILISLEEESGYDPFYSVNKVTKEFKDYSFLLAEDFREIQKKFIEAELKNGIGE